MGGYFNEFRREGLTRGVVLQLRAVISGVVGEDTASAVLKNAETFKKWYREIRLHFRYNQIQYILY